MVSVLILSLLLGAGADAAPELICCGGEEVFILSLAEGKQAVGDRVWRWRAADSPEIPADARRWFRTTDECKPLTDAILITSSSGGVALVRRRDKRCLFYTHARNAHSACMLPGKRVAVASSFGGDELLVYAVGEPTKQAEPLARIPLRGAHGAVWDSGRRRLWALGSDELLLVQIKEGGDGVKLVTERTWKLPTPGGHDLSPVNDRRHLYVTTDTNVYRFDRAEGTFSPDAGLGKTARVKSVTQHPVTGEVVYHQATEKNWWSDTIRFVGGRGDIRLPDERLYKVRWDVPVKEHEPE